MSIWGPILGAVAGGLVNNFFGSEEAEDNRTYNREQTESTNQQNIALSREMADRNEAFARETAANNERLQREFAQMGIQWRVQDAEAAGLHPLYALSGGGAAYSPSPAIVHQAPRVDAPPPASSSYMSDMGQNLGRAINAALDPVQRAERALQLQLLEAQVQRETAHAQYFRSQSRLEGAGGLPPMPGVTQAVVGSGGQRETLNVIDLPALVDTIKAEPSVIESSRSSDRSSTPGTRPMWSDFDAGGYILRLPSKGATEALESVEPLGMAATVWENVRYHRLLDGAFEFLERAGRKLDPRMPKERLPGIRFDPRQWTGGKFN